MALTEGRAVGVLGELLERDEILEAAAISTCNRTELYLYAADPVGAEAAALGLLSREAETQPTELVGHLYSLRGRGGGRASLPRHRRPRLDDHRRGRDPGPGQARLRAGPGRGRHRADPQPPVPRRARRGQAGPHGDGDLGALDVDPLGRRRARPAHARRARGSPGARRRRRRDGRAHRSRARRPRASRRSSSPTATTTARSASPSASAATRSASRTLPEELDRRRHRRRLDELAAPRDRARGARRGDGGARRAAAAADRPRRPARHPARPAATSPASASTTWTTCSRWSSATSPGREAEARRVEGDPALGARPLRALARGPGGDPDDRRAARARRRGRRAGARPRTSRAGRASRRPTASVCAVAARAIASRLLHEPTAAAQARGHRTTASYAKVAVLRELFGLDPDSEPLEAPGAEVSDLHERRRRRGR